MSRGRSPQVAITDAMHSAADLGYAVVPVRSQSLPFDFICYSRNQTIIVRVRRMRYPRYELADIQKFCTEEIAELRGIPISREIGRGLWVRGPGRAWHRYLILPEEILEEGAALATRSLAPERFSQATFAAFPPDASPAAPEHR